MSNQSTLYIDELGNKYWSLNGVYHREDGPAWEYVNENKWWYVNGKLHREDGPAITWGDGMKLYYLNDKEYIYDEWFSKLTPEQQYNYLWNLDE